MSRRLRGWLKWSLILIGMLVAVRAALRFPWTSTKDALVHARASLLLAALAINLLSLAAKGLSWHLLLRPVAPNRWPSAQSLDGRTAVGWRGRYAPASRFHRRCDERGASEDQELRARDQGGTNCRALGRRAIRVDPR